MGETQSTSLIYVCLSQLIQYEHKLDAPSSLSSFNQLIRTGQQQKINDNQLKISITDSLHYTLLTHTPYENIEEYEGCIEIISEDNIKVFEGIVKLGKKSEYGKQYNQKGQIVYEGQYQNDFYEGWGKTQHYQGQFFKGKRHGWGIYKDQQKKLTYEGMFEEGHFEGIGFLNIAEADVRNYMEHHSFISDPNLWFKYVGEWKNGKIHGRGKLATTSQIYSGQFSRGHFDGEGKLITKQGIVTEGHFLRGIHI